MFTSMFLGLHIKMRRLHTVLVSYSTYISLLTSRFILTTSEWVWPYVNPTKSHSSMRMPRNRLFAHLAIKLKGNASRVFTSSLCHVPCVWTCPCSTGRKRRTCVHAACSGMQSQGRSASLIEKCVSGILQSCTSKTDYAPVISECFLQLSSFNQIWRILLKFVKKHWKSLAKCLIYSISTSEAAFLLHVLCMRQWRQTGFFTYCNSSRDGFGSELRLCCSKHWRIYPELFIITQKLSVIFSMIL